MSDHPFASRYDAALDLIREAGDLALGYFNARDALTVKLKGVQDVVSEADLNTELLIRDRLSKAFPEDGFLGEETGLTTEGPDQGLWVVDPIDGTQPFISGLTGWCVSIGFVQGGKVRFGMVYAPARGELFSGGDGFPATLNGSPVPRHPGQSLREGIVGIGYSPRLTPQQFLPSFSALLERGATFYRDGSGALTLSYVAAGRLVGYLELHIMSWDCVGALGVVEGAGLRVNDFLADGGLEKGNRLIVGNAAVFPELEAALAAG